jgi:hypothetical protein
MEVDVHIHHLESLMSEVPEMAPFLSQRIRSLSLDNSAVTPDPIPQRCLSPTRALNEATPIGEWMENRVLVTSILQKNTIGYIGSKKALKTKNRSVFGLSLDEIYNVTLIPIPIVLAQSIHYLKCLGRLTTEVEARCN